MVVCGHVGATKTVYSTNTGVYGNTVHQFLVNPQAYDTKEDADGSVLSGTQDTGMVLYMNFSEDGSRITCDYYSTLLGKEMKGVEYNIKLYENNPATLIPGDSDNDGLFTPEDAIYLLYHANFPENYRVFQDFDCNQDGKITSDDAIYLLFSVYFPERYPLKS